MFRDAGQATARSGGQDARVRRRRSRFRLRHRARRESSAHRLLEKWTGFEGKALDAVVDAFNAKEREKARGLRICADRGSRVTVLRIEQKPLVASAGGNPPDVAGMYSFLIPAYADKGALVELGPRAAAAEIERAAYIEHYWDLGVFGQALGPCRPRPRPRRSTGTSAYFGEAGSIRTSRP